MAKIELKGFENYAKQMEKLAGSVDMVIKPAVYDGARVAADAIRAGIEALPADDSSRRHCVLTQTEKEGLLEGLGIAAMQKEKGAVNVRIGFEGYNAKGKANAMVARSLVKGTSFLKPNRFVAKATKKVKPEVLKVMQLAVEKKIEEFLQKG